MCLTHYKRYVQLMGGGSGSGCFGRGFSCGEKELQIARARLQGYFSLVLITDTSLHFRVGGLLMRHKFGWLASSDTDKARRGTQVEVCVCVYHKKKERLKKLCFELFLSTNLCNNFFFFFSFFVRNIFTQTVIPHVIYAYIFIQS
jgi:hypothetical protein